MYKKNYRKQYDREADEAAGADAVFHCQGPSLTQQQFARETDVNEIVRVYGGVDRIPLPEAPDPSYYFDLRGAPDLRSVLDAGRDAQEKFMGLPPELRARFHNRADLLWEFVRKPENHEEAVKLGLLRKHAPEPPPAS